MVRKGLNGWMTSLAIFAIIAAGAVTAAPSSGIFFMRPPGLRWNQNNPATITPEMLLNVTHTIDGVANPDLTVRKRVPCGHLMGSCNVKTACVQVGCAFVFSVLENYPNAESGLATLAASVTALLNASVTANVPIVVALDGENWWDTRADLWNWYVSRLVECCVKHAELACLRGCAGGTQHSLGTIPITAIMWSGRRTRPAPRLRYPGVTGDRRSASAPPRTFCPQQCCRRRPPACKRYLH